MLEPPTLPPECATCGRTFASWPLLSRHVHLDHDAATDGDVLTVAEILAARPADEPLRTAPTAHPPPSSLAVPPWLLGVVLWLAALYGLSRLGYSLAPLVAWSVLGTAGLGAVGLHLWARSELKRESARRELREP
jgi:hypothetical protein